mgnify:CR=1 FL=1
MRVCFNPRAHAGRDWCLIYTYEETARFNPRAHAGRDALGLFLYLRQYGFNPRAHAGRDADTNTAFAVFGRFNPRAHAGRDERQGKEPFFKVVSIHAPTLHQNLVCFNPRAHAGRDLTVYAHCQTRTFQSTRPRGARPDALFFFPLGVSFNPRAHAGRDTRWRMLLTGLVSFNPRAHAGRDPHVDNSAKRNSVSIHAPTRGATSNPFQFVAPHQFQSTRPRGARPM